MQENKKILYRTIALLLQYPENGWLQMHHQLEAAGGCLPEGKTRRVIAGFLNYLGSQPLLHLQETYTAVFDLNPATTLNMSYHLMGDGEKRAAMMVMLQEIYRTAGYDSPADDLPDFLPAMLEFLAVCPDAGLRLPVWQCLGGIVGLVDRLRESTALYADLLDLVADDYRHRVNQVAMESNSGISRFIQRTGQKWRKMP